MKIGQKWCMGLLTAVAACAHTAEITKNVNWKGALNMADAWVGGVVPGAEDVAVLNGDGGSYGLGGSLSWAGLIVTNAAAGLSITNDGSTLTLGAKGMKLGGTEALQTVTFYLPIVAATDQEWFSSNFKTCYIYGPVYGPGAVSLRNYPYYPTGQFVVTSTNAPAGGWGANAASIYLRDNACIQVAPSIGYNNTLYLDFEGDRNWKDIFTTRTLTTQGVLCFGTDWRAGNLIFEEGDSIAYGTYSATTLLALKKGRVSMTGGAMVSKTCEVQRGVFSQQGGSVKLQASLTIGNMGSTAASYLMDGGSLTLGQGIQIGYGNLNTVPAWLVVSNGTVSATYMIRLAASCSPSSGRMRMKGGTVAADGICFGASQGSIPNTNGVGDVELAGGELQIGGSGIQTADTAWNNGLAADAVSQSWYNVVLAGTKYVATSSHRNNVRMRLAGETELQAKSGTYVEQMAPIFGSGALKKTGAGSLFLYGTQSYTGMTEVAEGTLAVFPFTATEKGPSGLWRADALSLADGSTVSNWTCSAGTRSYSFSKGTTDAVAQEKGATITLPTFQRNRMNGHSAVVFDGAQNGLAMTGGADEQNSTPVHGATNLTVAIVLRAVSGKGAASTSWRSAAGIIGSQNDLNGEFSNWGIAVNAALQAGAGTIVSNTAANATTVWNAENTLADGLPHVLIYSWKMGESLCMNVDGKRVSQPESKTKVLSKNRILLGVNESLVRFGGEIAEIQFYRNADFSLAEEDALGDRLAAQYGIGYSGTSGVAVASAAMPAAEIPAASGVWTGDALTSVALGGQVTEWADTLNSGCSFNSTVGNAVFSSRTNPKVATTLMNGHKAVAFNGVNDALAMTGTYSPYYCAGATNLTVAIVYRTSAGGKGGASNLASTTAGIIGQWFGSPVHYWGVRMTAEGQCGGCIYDGSGLPMAAWAPPRYFGDNCPHVAIWTWSTNETMNVDGFVSQLPSSGSTAGRTPTRVTLGKIESMQGFCGDIAEIRFYKDVPFSAAQQTALGFELAKKYGAETFGYQENAAAALASRSIRVASGATLALPTSGLRLSDCQELSGAGTVSGTLVLGTNGVVAADASAAPVLDTLVFEPGGILRTAVNANGKPCQVFTAQNVILPAGEVTVDIAPASEVSPNGVILKWTGTLTDSGATWRVTGGKKNSAVVVDKGGKVLKLKTQSGTVIKLM